MARGKENGNNMNEGRIVIVQTDAVLFADIYPVQFFSESFIVKVVKIQTSYFISSVYGMAVRFHHRPKPLPQNQHIVITDLMFYFMSELQNDIPPFYGYHYTLPTYDGH